MTQKRAEYILPPLPLKGDSFAAWENLYNRWRVEKPRLRVGIVVADDAYNTKSFIDHALREGYRFHFVNWTQKAWLAERAIGVVRNHILSTLDRAGANLRYWALLARHTE